MQEPHAGLPVTGITTADMASLLGWWALAGVDTLTNDEARPWTAAAAEARVVAESARTLVRREAEPSQWQGVPTLAALRELVLSAQPNAPFADGNPESGLMLIGETPSADDLRTGRPFSGPAGQFLDRMLAAIGLDRTGCYITLLCPRAERPGPASPDSIAHDLDLARAHIRVVRPRIVLLMGAKPVSALTGAQDPIGRVRGNWLTIGAGANSVPALATFNPAYLLRRPEEKARAWADLLDLRRRLQQ